MIGPPRATGKPGDRSPFAAGLLLRRAHSRAADALRTALLPWGLRLRHFAVMIELAAENPLPQHELVTRVGLDKVAIMRIVDDLEAGGLAVRKPTPGDRRVRSVELTEQGFEVFDAAHVAAARINDELFAHFSKAQQDQLMKLLNRFAFPPDEG